MMVFIIGAPELAAPELAAQRAQSKSESVSRMAAAPHFAPALDTVRFERFRQVPAPVNPIVRMMYYALVVIIIIISTYTVRHYLFTINRLFARQRHPYADIITAEWPAVTVLIPAHNEELVIEEILRSLMDVDYPADRLTIMPVNDRSTDRTAEIIDSFATRFPGVIVPFHRTEGKPGKAAALKAVSEQVTTEIQIIFDADYLPSRGILKQLVAPFFDEEVGAVMGRVIPLNSGKNCLTRLQGLERSGGYQVDQQARMNLGLVPQYGGTVGGVRRRALLEAGGWRDDTLTEDTDATYRLLMKGHLTIYQNGAECYEEVPEAWPERMRQIRRWAVGHNECFRRYAGPLADSDDLPGGLLQKIDGLLLLGVYAVAPLVMIGWLLGLALFYLGYIPVHGFIGILAVASYSALGNFAAFFEVASAVRLDGSRQRARMLPFLFGGFLVSSLSIIRSMLPRHLAPARNRAFAWDKTKRYRAPGQ